MQNAILLIKTIRQAISNGGNAPQARLCAPARQPERFGEYLLTAFINFAKGCLGVLACVLYKTLVTPAELYGFAKLSPPPLGEGAGARQVGAADNYSLFILHFSLFTKMRTLASPESGEVPSNVDSCLP